MAAEFIFGWHAIESVLKQEPGRLVEVWIQSGRKDRRVEVITSQLDELAIAWQVVHRRELDSRVNGVHQGVVAEVQASRQWQEQDLDQLLDRAGPSPLLLILDGVTDPHNLGACLRTADAAGVAAGA